MQVQPGSPVCHDTASLLAVHFPYQAPKPASCATRIVVSPLTTLLATRPGLTPEALLAKLGLPSSYALLSTDSLAVRGRGRGCWSARRVHGPQKSTSTRRPTPNLPLPPALMSPSLPQGAKAGNADSMRVYRREAQVASLTLAAGKFLTADAASLPQARKAVLKDLAAEAAGGTGGGRRLLQSTMSEWPAGSGAGGGRKDGREGGRQGGDVQTCGVEARLPAPCPRAPRRYLLLRAPPADLSSGSTVEATLVAARLLAAAQIPTALAPTTPKKQAAVSNAIANLNAIIETATDVTRIQKVGRGVWGC